MNPVTKLERLARRIGSKVSLSKNNVPFVMYDDYRVAFMGRGGFFRVFKNHPHGHQERAGDFEDVESVADLLTSPQAPATMCHINLAA